MTDIPSPAEEALLQELARLRQQELEAEYARWAAAPPQASPALDAQIADLTRERPKQPRRTERRTRARAALRGAAAAVACLAALLLAFPALAYAIVPLKSGVFPLQFAASFQALTFFLLLFNFLYLLLSRKTLSGSVSSLWGWLGNSTLIMALWVLIYQYSRSFALHYAAAPASGFLARVGAMMQPFVTPLLYIGVLLLCIRLTVKR